MKEAVRRGPAQTRGGPAIMGNYKLSESVRTAEIPKHTSSIGATHSLPNSHKSEVRPVARNPHGYQRLFGLAASRPDANPMLGERNMRPLAPTHDTAGGVSSFLKDHPRTVFNPKHVLDDHPVATYFHNMGAKGSQIQHDMHHSIAQQDTFAMVDRYGVTPQANRSHTTHVQPMNIVHRLLFPETRHTAGHPGGLANASSSFFEGSLSTTHLSVGAIALAALSGV